MEWPWSEFRIPSQCTLLRRLKLRSILVQGKRIWHMSNNLTNLTSESEILKLSKLVMQSLVIFAAVGFLASCAAENSGRDVSAKRSQVPKAGTEDCVATVDKPCPTVNKNNKTEQAVLTKGDLPAFSASSLGFYETSDASLPEAVKIAANDSTVKLIIPVANLQTTKQIHNYISSSTSDENISNEELIEKLQKEIESAQEQAKKDELMGLQAQVQQCKQKNITDCKVLKQIVVQSGFLTTQTEPRTKETSTVVITTLDVIASYIKVKYELSTIEKVNSEILIFINTVLNKIELPIVIVNGSGEVLSGANTKINFSASDSGLNTANQNIHNLLKGNKPQPENLAIALRVEKITGKPIQNKTAVLELNSDDELFIVGAPHLSTSRARNNADGKNMFVTKGKQVQAESVRKALGLKLAIDKGEETKWIGLSNDSNNGLKGAAILNKDGVLIGIVSHSSAEPSATDKGENTSRSTLGIKKTLNGF